MSLIKKATEAQLAFLRNSGASFRVILADGEVVVHDPNNLLEPKKPEKLFKRGPKKNPDAERGEPTKYVMPFIKDLEPGQMVCIPNKYHPETMRSVICNHARRLWGDGSYMTEKINEMNEDGNFVPTAVSILRVK
jgi:hypothetical protein